MLLLFFSTFDKDLLANIHRHYWKERLKISRLAKYESHMYEASEEIALQSREILDRFVYLPPTVQTSVKSRDFADAYPCYFLTYLSQTWQLY